MVQLDTYIIVGLMDYGMHYWNGIIFRLSGVSMGSIAVAV
jgi:hypothetical protein